MFVQCEVRNHSHSTGGFGSESSKSGNSIPSSGSPAPSSGGGGGVGAGGMMYVCVCLLCLCLFVWGWLSRGPWVWGLRDSRLAVRWGCVAARESCARTRARRRRRIVFYDCRRCRCCLSLQSFSWWSTVNCAPARQVWLTSIRKLLTSTPSKKASTKGRSTYPFQPFSCGSRAHQQMLSLTRQLA